MRIVTLALALTACADPCHTAFRLEGATAEQRAVTANALEAWRSVGVGVALAPPGPSDAPIIFEHLGPTGWAGHCNATRIVVNVDELYSPDEHLRYVVIHEVGHWIGLSHSAAPDSIMQAMAPRQDMPLAPSPTDAAAARTVCGCCG